MAKVSYSKLKCAVDQSVKTVHYEGEAIEVKQYLPIQEKLGLIGSVITQAHEEDKNFANPVKIQVYRNLEIVKAYTNISFTDKQKEDLPKLYDQMASSGLLTEILAAIPEEEYVTIVDGIWESVTAYYAYRNSALGILDGVREEQNQANVDVAKLKEEIAALADAPVIKDILPLIGRE